MCRNVDASINLPCLGLPNAVVAATEQPLTVASAVPADSTPTPPRDSRESDDVASTESNALTGTRHDEVAAELDINTTERDLEAGPPIPSPVQSDDDVDEAHDAEAGSSRSTPATTHDESDVEIVDAPTVTRSAPKSDSQRVLEYFNDRSVDELRELTGMYYPYP